MTPVDPTPMPPSARQARLGRHLNKADRFHFNPHVAVSQRPASWSTHRVFTLGEQTQIASAIVDVFSRLALEAGPKVSASARKNYATAYGIATDKLAALQGRPTEILRIEESESQRPAILALVRKLANLREAEAAGPDASP
jgi:hypothetical protein